MDRPAREPAVRRAPGRYWLDLARYADTNGIHFDNYREMYAYRDWVIGAFNANMPYSQFTVEQLAGDLLPHPTMDEKHRDRLYSLQHHNQRRRLDRRRGEGQLRARPDRHGMSQVFLGETAACAVCHDHKFDPISQK